MPTQSNPPGQSNDDSATSESENAVFVDKFPKSTCTRAQVEEMAQNKLENGATSSVITEDATYWILTTTWPGG